MLCQFQVYSKVNQLKIYIYPLFLMFFSHIGPYRVLSRALHAIQQVLACVHAKSLHSCPNLWTLWTIALQAPLSVRFSRQEYWSGLPCPPPGDLPDPESLLVTQWIYVNPNLPIYPSYSFPPGNHSLISTSVTSFLFCNQVYLYHFFQVPHINNIT